jgi:hypothetical protein
LRKFSPKLVWECKWDYKDEDKKYCRNEVVKILKLCKKESIFTDKPTIANLIYINRLKKRKEEKENPTKEQKPKEEGVLKTRASREIKKESENLEVNVELSEFAIKRWGSFLKRLTTKPLPKKI